MTGNKKDSGSGLKLIQHKHCAVCGKAQLVSDPEVCSPECKKVVDDGAKKKRMWWIYMGLLFAALALFIIVPMFVKF
jgi:predicted nucleic acid-binding Zn ribbon protein